MKGFFHRHLESTEYTVLYTRRCRAKLNQLLCLIQVHDRVSQVGREYFFKNMHLKCTHAERLSLN